MSTTGAASPFLRRQIERIWASLEADLEATIAASSASLVISADGARNPPQLCRSARTRSPHCAQRRPCGQDQRKPALRN